MYTSRRYSPFVPRYLGHLHVPSQCTEYLYSVWLRGHRRTSKSGHNDAELANQRFRPRSFGGDSPACEAFITAYRLPSVRRHTSRHNVTPRHGSESTTYLYPDSLTTAARKRGYCGTAMLARPGRRLSARLLLTQFSALPFVPRPCHRSMAHQPPPAGSGKLICKFPTRPDGGSQAY